jgi:hypothetical protein
MGFNDFKFGFPITKDMRFESSNAAHFSNPIIKPFMRDGVLNLVPVE